MIAAALLALTLATPVAARVTPDARSLPDCTTLSASLDSKDGDFDGMSHSGVLLVLRNDGAAACRVGGLPTVSFLDRRGRTLPIARRPPVGMHPGPVVVPLTLAPGAAASTGIRWVSGNVFDNGRCLTPATIVVRAGSQPLKLPFGRGLCGARGEAIPFDQPPLQAQPAPPTT